MAGNKNNRLNWTSRVLYILYLAFLFTSVVIVIKILSIQIGYKPSERVMDAFGMVRKTVTEVPQRGKILSCDGKILAMSSTMYDVRLDCEAMLDEFRKNPKKEAEKDSLWCSRARELCDTLADIYGGTPEEIYARIMKFRHGKDANGKKFKGRRDMKFGDPVDYKTLRRLLSSPLFKEKGGYSGKIINSVDIREYPYGSLARSAIGKVSNNTELVNDKTGMEGKYNYRLHGKDGKLCLKKTDARNYIPDETRVSIPAENGDDIRTTINIEYQNIADKALRRALTNENIAGGCVIIMETATGAIRAMVNLQRDKSGHLGETFNYAVRQAASPGSIFKVATLTALLDEGKVSINDMVPTFGGQWTYKGVLLRDDYILPGIYPEKQISISEGLAISSNHVFRYLAPKFYEKNPQAFIEKLYEFKLMEKFDFDIDGLATPYVRKPADEGWSPVDLTSVAMGYSLRVTPLNMITFYNAIANGGKMMKPYLVEDFEQDGKVTLKKGPEVVVGSICKSETAEEVKKAMLRVTQMNYDGPQGRNRHGTGWWAFRNAKCLVAGKTGTSRVEFEFNRNGKRVWGMKDDLGRHVHQGSFIGMFPYEAPKYTVMSVTYTKPLEDGKNVYGATSAGVVAEITDALVDLNPQWAEVLPATGSAKEYLKK